MSLGKTITVAVSGLLALALVAPAGATNFSFTGNFTQDDDIQLFSFTVGAISTVTLRTWSYAGGTNAAGTLIPRGGFDPILALFSSTGALIGQNDDGGVNVPADAVTGAHYDTYLQLPSLGIGSYTVSITQYDNFANGPNLSNGFLHEGDGNFRSGGGCSQFRDARGDCRDGHWAFDVLNVQDATAVPEPGTLTLLGLGLASLWSRRRSRA